jgi:hypothetical protein
VVVGDIFVIDKEANRIEERTYGEFSINNLEERLMIDHDDNA